MAEIKITKENFEAEVLKSDKPVLVDFWASWCGPCMALGPVVAEISEELEGKVKVCKVNVDEEAELANQFGIMSIPALFVFKDGHAVKQTVGLQSKQALLDMLK